MKQPEPNYCACGCGTALKRNSAGRMPTWARNHHLYIDKTPRSDSVTGCLIWQRATGGPGYGYVRVAGKTITAHRAAWEKVNGQVPAGHELHHRCERKACVNPAHLELTTRSAHSTYHGLQRGAPYLKYSDAEVRGALDLVAAGWEKQAVARAYGMSPSHLYNLLKGRQRADVSR